jgi:hypothetical protein
MTCLGFAIGFAGGASHVSEIHKISPTGADLGVFANLSFGSSNIVFDASGNLYVEDFPADGLIIRKFGPDGADLGSFANPGGYWLAISPVPEPSTFALAAVGIGLGILFKRRRSPYVAAILSASVFLVGAPIAHGAVLAYQLTDLGTVGGTGHGIAYAINSSGQVVGETTATLDGHEHACG